MSLNHVSAIGLTVMLLLTGCMESDDLEKDDSAYVPPNSTQFIENSFNNRNKPKRRLKMRYKELIMKEGSICIMDRFKVYHRF